MGWAVGLVIITGTVVKLTSAVWYMGWAVRCLRWAVGLVIITGTVVNFTTTVGYMCGLLGASGQLSGW